LQILKGERGSAILREAIREEGQEDVKKEDSSPFTDFSEVQGQDFAKRACEIAAAGGHHFLFVGSPGCGKSMLARAFPGILPDMSRDECLKSSIIHSVAGKLKPGEGLLKYRPFRSPHHSVSRSGLIGGGSIPKPGEVSLAHNGFLFLDELGEFKRDVLETLRQPLERDAVTLSRSRISLEFPCAFLLGAAMNPCPCGFLLDSQRECTCHPKDVRRYLSKVSGPLLDRMDLQVEMQPVETGILGSELLAGQCLPKQKNSRDIQQRVYGAWKVQKRRFAKNALLLNARMTPRDIKQFCVLSPESKRFLDSCIASIHLSARAYYQVIRVSRTIADLGGCERIQGEHIAEALQYRGLDRTFLHITEIAKQY
jgi:magnesium chelatase family protein